MAVGTRESLRLDMSSLDIAASRRYAATNGAVTLLIVLFRCEVWPNEERP